jgi:hypothetical protein
MDHLIKEARRLLDMCHSLTVQSQLDKENGRASAQYHERLVYILERLAQQQLEITERLLHHLGETPSRLGE